MRERLASCSAFSETASAPLAGLDPLGAGDQLHVIRYVPGTSRIAGLTMLGPRRILERDGRLVVTIPEAIEATADDLAPALAAG